MVFSHAFAGAITTHIILKNKNIDDKLKNILYFAGIIGAIFPDFDIIAIALNDSIHHRYLITHSFFPYISLFLVVWLIASLIKSKKIYLLNWVLFVGIMSHLIIDFLIGGIVAFAPFNFTLYGFELFMRNTGNGFAYDYIRSFYMVPEILLPMLGVYILKKEKNLVAKYLPWGLFFVATTALVILAVL